MNPVQGLRKFLRVALRRVWRGLKLAKAGLWPSPEQRYIKRMNAKLESGFTSELKKTDRVGNVSASRMNPIESAWRDERDHRHPSGGVTVEAIKEDEQIMQEHDPNIHIIHKPTYPI